MGDIKVGDIVARKSYGGDILFKVVDVGNKGEERIVTLKGITYRIEADAPESDLIVQNDQSVKEYTSVECREPGRKCKGLKFFKKCAAIKKKIIETLQKKVPINFRSLGICIILIVLAILLLLVWGSIRSLIVRW